MDGHIGNVASFRPTKRVLHPDLIPIASDMLIVWDFLTVLVSGYICALVYANLIAPGPLAADFLVLAKRISIMGAVLAMLVLRGRKLTGPSHAGSITETIGETSVRVFGLIGLLLVIGFMTRMLDQVPRLWAVVWFAATFAGVIGGRILLVVRLRALEAQGMLRERIAIVGAGPIAERLIQHIRKTARRRIDIVGVFSDLSDPDIDFAGGSRDLASLVELGKEHAIDRVILALPTGPEGRLADIVRQVKALDVEVALCPPTVGLSPYPVHVGFLADIPLLVLANRPIRRWGMVLKAFEDRVLSAILLVLLSPLFLAIALAVRLDSPGPVIFRQRRVGLNNAEFFMLKFRSMYWQGPQHATGEKQTLRNDPRVTRVGRFIRGTSLDELPQLVNVLRGEMSLVGPRPHALVMRTEELLCHEIVEDYDHRHRVKPGITGLAQVSGFRGATETVETLKQRYRMDIRYVDNWSILLDVKILLKTPIVLLFNRRNAF